MLGSSLRRVRAFSSRVSVLCDIRWVVFSARTCKRRVCFKEKQAIMQVVNELAHAGLRFTGQLPNHHWRIKQCELSMACGFQGCTHLEWAEQRSGETPLHTMAPNATSMSTVLLNHRKRPGNSHSSLWSLQRYRQGDLPSDAPQAGAQIALIGCLLDSCNLRPTPAGPAPNRNEDPRHVTSHGVPWFEFQLYLPPNNAPQRLTLPLLRIFNRKTISLHRFEPCV